MSSLSIWLNKNKTDMDKKKRKKAEQSYVLHRWHVCNKKGQYVIIHGYLYYAACTCTRLCLTLMTPQCSVGLVLTCEVTILHFLVSK